VFEYFKLLAVLDAESSNIVERSQNFLGTSSSVDVALGLPAHRMMYPVTRAASILVPGSDSACWPRQRYSVHSAVGSLAPECSNRPFRISAVAGEKSRAEVCPLSLTARRPTNCRFPPSRFPHPYDNSIACRHRSGSQVSVDSFCWNPFCPHSRRSY
jgi:hypothetical protein